MSATSISNNLTSFTSTIYNPKHLKDSHIFYFFNLYSKSQTQKHYLNMHFSLSIFSVAFLIALASCIPATLYRGDATSPTAAHAAGGLKAKGYGRSDHVAATRENLFKHVSKNWGKVSPLKDIFISTSVRQYIPI
jgi:hypothetical protein